MCALNFEGSKPDITLVVLSRLFPTSHFALTTNALINPPKSTCHLSALSALACAPAEPANSIVHRAVPTTIATRLWPYGMTVSFGQTRATELRIVAKPLDMLTAAHRVLRSLGAPVSPGGRGRWQEPRTFIRWDNLVAYCLANIPEQVKSH